jgi:hypothetical protein
MIDPHIAATAAGAFGDPAAATTDFPGRSTAQSASTSCVV